MSYSRPSSDSLPKNSLLATQYAVRVSRSCGAVNFPSSCDRISLRRFNEFIVIVNLARKPLDTVPSRSWATLDTPDASEARHKMTLLCPAVQVKVSQYGELRFWHRGFHGLQRLEDDTSALRILDIVCLVEDDSKPWS